VTGQVGEKGERVTARVLELVVGVEGVNEQVSMDVLVLLDGIEGQKQDAIDKVERVLTIDAMVRYKDQYGKADDPPSKVDFLRNDPVVNALRVVYPYARTCHRAQGSEWDTVIVDLSHDTGPPPGWEYTAVTRARKQLVVVNKRQATGELDVAAELRPLIENLDLQVDFLELQHGAQQLTISNGSSELLVNVYLKQSLPSKIDRPHGDDTLWNLVNPVLRQWAARVRARYRPVNDLTVSEQLNKLMGTVDASGIQVTCYKAGQWEVEVDAIDESGNQASFRMGHNSAGRFTAKKITGEGNVGDLLSLLKDNVMH